MKASDYVIQFFEERGIDTVFGYIGGMITHLVDSIATNNNVQFIQTYHEQTAAIAAEGYARKTGNLGLAISTSGPGVTNMMTGIANAYFDSIPVIYITGQVNSYDYKYDKPIRQQGFQEMDVVSVTKAITKYSVLVDDPESLRYELEKAYHLALEGRQGPVVLDIPMNIQRAEIKPENLKGFSATPQDKNLIKNQISDLAQLINASTRPMVLIGGGVKADTKNQLIEFLDKTGFPVVTSLMGIGTVKDSKSFLGMIGSYGNRMANMAIANADLVIALGTRLDTRQTGAMYTEFVKKGTIIHVDVDNNELDNHRLENRIKVNSSVKSFLQILNQVVYKHDISKWIDYLSTLKSNYNQENEVIRFVENKSPYKFMQTLNSYSKEGDTFCADIGQNQMWAAQSLIMKDGQNFFTSGGLAPMGYALPAAVGTAFTQEDGSVFAICGDGGFHMSTQALALISQYNLPVKVIVMNNVSLGMITQFQELYFDKRMSGTVEKGGYLTPNISMFAKTYNLEYFHLDEDKLSDLDLMDNIFSTRNCIIEFSTNGLTKVYPKLEYNQPIERVSPFLPEEELINNMFKA